MRTSGDDQYQGAVGLFQEIKTWTITGGYRHFQQSSGDNLHYRGLGASLDYAPQIREVSDAVEAGFSYALPKNRIKLEFYTRKTFDGGNTDSAFWVSGYVEIPIGGKK